MALWFTYIIYICRAKQEVSPYYPFWVSSIVSLQTQETNQEHTNILWTYPVADRMIYCKKVNQSTRNISTTKYV